MEYITLNNGVKMPQLGYGKTTHRLSGSAAASAVW